MSQPEEKTAKQPSGMYPNIFESSEQRRAAGSDLKNGGGSDEEDEELLTGTQVLVSIPGAIVHLIDKEESVHLASGDFSLVRLIQEKTKAVVIAKVGKELQWPLVQEEPVVKLDRAHYFFNLKVPADMDGNDSPLAKSGQKSYSESDDSKAGTLNYGVTFPAESASVEEHTSKIRELDYFLERYSTFTAPFIVQGEAVKDAEKQGEVTGKLSPRDPNFAGTVVPEETISGQGKVVPTEDTSQAFWTTMAPDVDDYNHKMAKGIARGAGQVVRGIFWLSDSTVQNLDSGSIYMQHKFNKKDKPSKISPITMRGVRSARKLTQMTDIVAAGVLGGIVYTSGLLSSAIVRSPPGKMFFKTLPGEVVLVSLDAFNSVFDAIEEAGRDVMGRSSSVTQEFVNHRYGETAKELTDESLRTVGHVAAVGWTLTKIRKALNPSKLKVSKTGIAKSLAKQAGNQK